MHPRLASESSLKPALAVALSLFAAATCSSGPTERGGPVGSAAAMAAPRAPGVPADRAAVPFRPTPEMSRPHPFNVNDMVRMERVGAPVPSPDGRYVLFTRQAWDPDANQKTTNLWVALADGSSMRALTSAKGVADSSPVWTPDSKAVLFLSSRESGKLFIARLDGGEPRPLFALPIEGDNLRLSPDGKNLAFTAEIYPGTTIAETQKLDAEKAKRPSKARTYESLMVRHWDAWDEGKRNHLLVAALTWNEQGEPALAGEARDLMKSLDGDCPIRPFGGTEDFVFSPDGQEIAYVTQLGHDKAWSTNLDVFTVPTAGGETVCVTKENLATDHAPAYSPDGSKLLWLAMARPGFEADRQVIHLLDRKSGAITTLADQWDRSVATALWAPDGSGLYCTAEEEARTRIFRVDAATGAVTKLVGDHWNDGVALLPGRDGAATRLVFTQDSFTQPAELHCCALDGTAMQTLTHVNDSRIALAQMAQPEEFWFVGANGEKVQSWIAKPVGFEPGKKYPLAFVIHGGPQGVIGDHFHYRWNLNAFAGAGYGVMAVNFHGSTGFGQKFTDSISRDWGGKPFEDLMKGLDAALDSCDWIDTGRIGALGASYGGWMINWVNGHTDRFKALVCHDGEFDVHAGYFTTEELWFSEWEFGGVPWENPELFDKFSPGRYVADWKTPELVIHSANDFRLIDAEGLAAFTGLQRRGIPSKYLWFPDENHWVLKPVNSIFWHQNVIEWLDRWVMNG